MKLALVCLLGVATLASAKKDATDLAASKAPKKQRVLAPLVNFRKLDSWCHQHHVGSGAPSCTQHNGCCYNAKVDKQYKKLAAKLKRFADQDGKDANMLREQLSKWGPCHSCDHHETTFGTIKGTKKKCAADSKDKNCQKPLTIGQSWCSTYGSKGAKKCLDLAWCTWNVAVGKKGTCVPKVSPADYPEVDMSCNLHLGNTKSTYKGEEGLNIDQQYVDWVKCVDESIKKSKGLCYKKATNTDEKAPATKKPIVQPAGKKGLWDPTKKPCSYEKCKRNANRRSPPRCDDGYQFKWEMESSDDIQLAGGKKKKNTKIGTDKLGCKEKYAYKARCVTAVKKNCKKTKVNGVLKTCEKDFDCNGGKDKCVAGKGKRFTADYLPNQADEDGKGFDGYFCVDKDGHEIPDTRKMRPVELFDISCSVQRKKSEGMQCPNAMTLTTVGGLLVMEDKVKKPTKKNCAVHCNSDTDCKGEKWCCFNGCGYTCKKAVKPLAGCRQPPGSTQIAEKKWVLATKGGMSHQLTGNERHGIELTVKCAADHAQTPYGKGTPRQSLEVKCHHGEWVFCPKGGDCTPNFEKLLICEKNCPKFRLVASTSHLCKEVDGKVKCMTVKNPATVKAARQSARDVFGEGEHTLRIQDIVELSKTGFKAGKGNDLDQYNHHGSTRKIACPPGYGAVQHSKFLAGGKTKAGKAKKVSAISMHIVRHGYEVITCGANQPGEWTPRHLECNVCYDAYEWEWRDKKGNSCAFYRSRPLLCGNPTAQTIPRTKDDQLKIGNGKKCGTYSKQWAAQGLKLLEDGVINQELYFKRYQPYQGFPASQYETTAEERAACKKERDNCPICKAPFSGKYCQAPTRRNRPRGKAKTLFWSKQGATRMCLCTPETQPAFLADAPTSPPSTCGQLKQGKKIFVNPLTGKKFGEGGKTKSGIIFAKGAFGKAGSFFYEQISSFGSATDACRVSCRTCQQAENKFLQRTRYDEKTFYNLVNAGKIKLKNVGKTTPGKIPGGKLVGKDESNGGKGKWVKTLRKVQKWKKISVTKETTKTIVKSYDVADVCTDGKGTNWVKCGKLKKEKGAGREKEFRPECLKKQLTAAGCKKGFKPMA